jgi:hypothetical protein
LTDDNGIYIQITGSNKKKVGSGLLMELKMINVSLEKSCRKFEFN